MTGPERGFLLLCCQLGDPERKSLTLPQLRVLSRRVSGAPAPEPGEVTAAYLVSLGYGPAEAGRIALLLSQERLLDRYLCQASRLGITVITRISPGYPPGLAALRPDCPPVLFLRGEESLLQTPCVALVGSRVLREENRRFAEKAGREIARQGFTLVSGGAKGADLTAQEACLAAGGHVISIVADDLSQHSPRPGMLLCSETGFDLPFTPQRALHRNHLIHCLARKVLVAQSRPREGGTWNGTAENLKRGWSPVFIFDDGSPGARGLMELGAAGISLRHLSNLAALSPAQTTFL